MSVKKEELVIIGAGPTGLSAAIYTTREEIPTTLLEKGAVGGLAAITDWIDNYPGFHNGIDGITLSDELSKQAERFGAKIQYAEVSKIERINDHILITSTDGNYSAKALLIAIGSDYKKLGVKGENEFYARGVHYCATCDGAFYKGKKLAVIGGGNSAIQESLFLTRFATHIDLIVRSEIKATEVLQRELEKFIKKGQISVHLNTSINEIIGHDNMVDSVSVKKDGKDSQIKVDGVFVFVGLMPNTGFIKDTVELDDHGLIKTDNKLMTNIKGVFAAGDVRSGATMQIASAVGEGATAALHIREYLEDLKR